MIASPPTGFLQVIDQLGQRRQGPEIPEALLRMYPRKELLLYTSVASACLRGGVHKRALEIIQEAEKEGFIMDQLSSSLGLQAAYLTDQLGVADHYLGLLQSLEKGGHSNSTANFGVCVLAKLGDWDRVELLLNNIVDQQKKGRLFGVNELTLATVTEVAEEAHLDEDRRTKIVHLLAHIRDKGIHDGGSKGPDANASKASLDGEGGT